MATLPHVSAGPLDADLVVTGEAVPLEVRPASVLSRSLAFLLDAVGYVAVGLGMTAVVSAVPWADEAAVAAAGVAAVAGVLVVFPTAVETLTRGRSLGKWAAGIVVVRDDGGPVRLRQSLVRALVGIGEIWMTSGAIALTAAILHPRGKRLGDVAAGTTCVRVRGARAENVPLILPPELAGWVAVADIRALPDGVALEARRFLARRDTLHPRSRDTLGRSLAAQVEPLVAPPPPWGTPPERFLTAVLVARRDVELAREQAARAAAAAEGRRLRRLPFGIDDG